MLSPKRPRNPKRWSAPIEKGEGEHDVAFRPNAGFFATADQVLAADRTRMGYDNLYVLWQAVGNAAGVEGAVAEIGSYRGGSAYFIASAFVTTTGAEVPMHIFDTFDGHPAQAITEHDPFQTAGHFRTNYQNVVAYLSPFTRLEIHRGDVSESLSRLAESRYRLVHIDTDLYKPTLDCLDYFGRRLSAGGVVVIDDYSSGKCPCVPKATAEYLQGTDLRFHAWDLRTEQLVLTRH